MIMITMKVTKITTTKHVNGKMFSVSRLFMKRNFMDALVKTLILLHAYKISIKSVVKSLQKKRDTVIRSSSLYNDGFEVISRKHSGLLSYC